MIRKVLALLLIPLCASAIPNQYRIVSGGWGFLSASTSINTNFVSTWTVPADGLITVPTTGTGYDGTLAVETLAGAVVTNITFSDASITNLTDIDVSAIGAAGTEFRMRIGGTFPELYINPNPADDTQYYASTENLYNTVVIDLDYSGVTNTAGYDAYLNTVWGGISPPTNITINVGSVKYSYKGYYAHVGLAAEGWTLTDGGLDTTVYAAEDYLNLGDELVVNGGFDTDTAWTKQTGWTISGLTANAAIASGSWSIFQTVSSITENQNYLFEFTVLNYSSGQVRARQYDNYGPYVSANGSYQHVVVGDSLPFVTGINGNAFTGSIDNVSVREILPETP